MQAIETRHVILAVTIVLVMAFLSLFPVVVSFASVLVFPGLLLVWSSSVAMYLLPTAAICFGLSGPRIRHGLLGLGVIMALAISYAPGWIAHQKVQELTRDVVTLDFAEPAVLQPKSIELAGVLARRDYKSGRPICMGLCQKLLFNGKVGSVLVKPENDGEAQRFRIERREKCPDVEVRLVGRFGNRIAHGECLIEETASSPTPDIVVRVSSGPRARVGRARQACKTSNRPLLWLVDGPIQTLDVHERIDGRLVLKEHRAKLHVRIPSTPFIIKPLRCGGSFPKLTTHVATKAVVISDFQIVEVLKRRYSISLDAIETAPVPKQRDHISKERYRHILTRVYNQDEVVTRFEAALVDEFISSIFRKEKLDGEDIELLQLAIRQPALSHASSFRYNRHMASLVPLMPDMVTRLELPIQASQGRKRHVIRRNVSALLGGMDKVELRRFSIRLGNILNDPERARYALEIIHRWGEISDEPLPTLFNLARGKDRRTRISALTGLCRIATAQDSGLISYFLSELEQSLSDYNTPKPIAVALVRVGLRSEVMEIIQRSPTPQTDQLQLFLDSIGTEPDIKKCRVR